MTTAEKHMQGPVLSTRLFKTLSNYITDTLGIKMPPSKSTMLQSRLQKRLRQLGMNSFEDYYEFVFSGEGKQQELHHLLDAVTTNKTDFFREPRHYDVLKQMVLPELLNTRGCGLRRPLKVWSAGCSTGAEPYTLAMVFSEFGERVPEFKFQILATDISTKVLQKAVNAIYEEHEAAPIPISTKKKFLLRSKDRRNPRIRIAPELRRLVEFRRLNLMAPDYYMANAMDIILCRNVIIYFDRQTQQNVLNRLCHCLKPGGFLFTGHSETLNGFVLPLAQVASTVYRKRG